MPSGPLAHVCLLVNDLDRAVEDWTKILSILDPHQLDERVVRYEDFEGGEDQMRWATFVSHHGTEIQLMQPSPGSPLGRRLAKHGEGAHHICFTVENPEQAQRLLAEQGLTIGGETSQDPSMPWQRWNWLLADSAHGILVEVARPYKAVDGEWVDGSEADGA
jgi:methylmalonyl-CoA/ethylmalonyl-CoA epimerase